MRTLLIEDSEADQILVKKMLVGSSIEVECADTLAVGLEQLGRRTFDTVLLDVHLPDAEGMSGLLQIRRLFPGIPVVVLTGTNSEEIGLKSIREGAQDYLVKGEIEREQLARSLSYSIERQRISSQISQLPEGIYSFTGLLEKYGTVVHINRESTEMMGVKSSDCQGKPFWETAFWSHSAELQSRVRQSIQTACNGKKDSFLATHKLASGKFIEVEFTLAPSVSPNNKIVLLVAHGHDVTARNQAERKLEEARLEGRRSKFFMDNSSEAIYWLGPDSRFLYVNQAACEMLDYEEKELLSLRAVDVDKNFPPDVWGSFWSQMKVERYRRFETKHVRKGGGTMNVHATLYFHEFEDEEFIVGVTRDVTKEKKANLELERFAYAAAHDLRTPLRGISHVCSMIKDEDGEKLSDFSKACLQKLEDRVKRMEILVKDLFNYSQAGKSVGKPQLVDVNVLVHETVDLVDPTDGLDVQIDSELPTLEAYPSLLQQVFLNLIGNAVKYHDKPDGYIRVSAVEEGDFFRFLVEDNGQGIEKKFHDRVFEMFQRLHSKDEIDGTGLGLAIVRRVVEANGGRVWLESEAGVGSTFGFTWPKCKIEADVLPQND